MTDPETIRALLRRTPELPGETAVTDIDLPKRIKRVLLEWGYEDLAFLRETSDKTLETLPDLGPRPAEYLRGNLGWCRSADRPSMAEQLGRDIC